MSEISVELLHKLTQQIYQKLGLHFDDKKAYFLRTRVAKRMAALSMASAKDYVFMVSYGDPEGLEMQELANLVTTNETYMFREYDQLQAFANHCLPEVLSSKLAKGDKSLSQSWDCKIVATDIDELMLEKTAAARYGQRSVKDVPQEYKDKYLRAERGEYAVGRKTTALVQPMHLNLHDRMALRTMRGFDFIFCRNVLIYFDDASRKAVVDHFYTALNPGGYIFLGHSESVGRVTTAFKLKQFESHLVYVKE